MTLPSSTGQVLPVALLLAYDGEPFEGWQLQPARPTVQGAVERALRAVHGVTQRVPVVGAGRTDTGVHALGQVASYFPPTRRSESVLLAGLNALLPAAIRVLDVRTMGHRFHACRSAVGKIYRYRIVNRALLLPFERHQAWHVRSPLDLEAIRRAAGMLEGRHDFSTFANAGGQSKSMVRHLQRLAVHVRPGGVIEIEAQGNGFLYRMVRNLTGFLVDVGLHRRNPEETVGLLEARDRSLAGRTAPAAGLCLVRVIYRAGC